MKSHNVAIFLIAITLTGCTGATSQNINSPIITSTPGTAPLRIALVMKTLTNPFFAEMEKGARKAESELGITLIVKTAAQETSIEQQISIIDELTRQKVDAIVIAPEDSKDLIPTLKKAQDAGIALVNIDNRLDPDLSKTLGLTNVPFISVDNLQAAYKSAKYISDQVSQPTKALIIEGMRTAQNGEDRRQGALKAFKENPNITVVASETANWKIDESHDVTKKLLDQYPDVSVIFCANDMMALGTIQYLSEAQKSGVMVASFDALKEAKQAIKDGKLMVTIDQQAAQQGYLGVQYAVRVKKGEKLPSETYVDVLVVDKQGVN